MLAETLVPFSFFDLNLSVRDFLRLVDFDQEFLHQCFVHDDIEEGGPVVTGALGVGDTEVDFAELFFDFDHFCEFVGADEVFEGGILGFDYL